MILVIDNYDSFSYNLVQYIGSIEKKKYGSASVKVVRNDELTVADIEEMAPDYIILSPGPGRPDNAGICEELVVNYKGDAKILGVCLGHQAIIEAFGGIITYAKQLMHGKQSAITFDENEELFQNIPEGIKVARYHSLAGDEKSIPECLSVIARTGDGEVMAVKHKERPIYGFQFHPESVLTEHGMEMLENFLSL